MGTILKSVSEHHTHHPSRLSHEHVPPSSHVMLRTFSTFWEAFGEVRAHLLDVPEKDDEGEDIDDEIDDVDWSWSDDEKEKDHELAVVPASASASASAASASASAASASA